MKFLKDIKQAFQEGYNESVRENEREERMINELKKKPVTSTEAREVFMKLKEKELNEEFMDWIEFNDIILK
ncbi:MAG: hypothetical protein MSL49_03765 [Lactobacillus johnsonii]|nr:hypothetical protein [Lactobacillus johnsonii]